MNFILRTVMCLAVAIFLTLTVKVSPAQKKKPQLSPGDKMIAKYLAAETDKLSQKVFDGATSLAEWKERRPRLQRELLHMLGLDPLPKKTPLQVTFTGTVEHEGVLIDKLHFQSRPSLYVTANLYRPKGTEQRGAKRKRYPAVVYVCGHSNRGRDGNKTAFQDHGIWFARNGYLCIMLDTLQLGEIPGVHHGTYGRPYNHLARYGIKGKNKLETRWWWHSAGYTPAGVECWNGIRAIDYLISRPDVDAKRIAVTGISGGGATTFWIAAADDRVACAVPVSGMSDLESYVKNKVIDGHCDCMFMYNTFQWEWTTIAALIAPRPLMFANSDNDRIFPMDGNRRITARLRKLYKWYGKSENFKEYVSKGGHAYRPDLRVAIFRFINKHVKGDAGDVKDSAGFKTLPGEKLRVFATDADVPKDQINTKVDEVFVQLAKVDVPEKGKFVQWKKKLVQELQSKCFRVFPKEIPAANVSDTLTGLITESGIYCESITARPGKANTNVGLLFVTLTHPFAKPKFRKPIAKDYLDKLVGSGQVDALWPRGSFPELGWNRKSPPNYVERSHVLLGRTVDQGRVFDIIATAKRLNNDYKGKIRWTYLGVGQAGILAAYAALFEPSIKEVVIIDPPTSHKAGPHFLNVLRVLDIPEALGLLAPRVKLTLINAKDKAFDRTAAIYRAAGATKMFVRK